MHLGPGSARQGWLERLPEKKAQGFPFEVGPLSRCIQNNDPCSEAMWIELRPNRRWLAGPSRVERAFNSMKGAWVTRDCFAAPRELSSHAPSVDAFCFTEKGQQMVPAAKQWLHAHRHMRR